jgi:DNA-binding PadR family transcriptional regulator
MGKSFLGEFEQMVLLAVLQLDDRGYALGIRNELERRAGRAVSRGALYRTLDRLEEKSLVEWSLEEETPARGGHPRRRFQVTAAGIEALRNSREALFALWEGLDAVLEERP